MSRSRLNWDRVNMENRIRLHGCSSARNESTAPDWFGFTPRESAPTGVALFFYRGHVRSERYFSADAFARLARGHVRFERYFSAEEFVRLALDKPDLFFLLIANASRISVYH
jgi:hypothetical protein